MSGARYPLASLLALRERERDAAAQTLALAMGTLAEHAEQVRLAAETHARALSDLAAYQLHDGSRVGAAGARLKPCPLLATMTTSSASSTTVENAPCVWAATRLRVGCNTRGRRADDR